MTKEEFLSLMHNGSALVSKRCTEDYLSKRGLLNFVLENAPEDFESISDKVRFIKYGGGYCKTCGNRTNVAAGGQGFASYCKTHFHDSKKNKRSHNHKDVDLQKVIEMYESGMAMYQIAEKLGNISNVSLSKKLKASGYEIRSHSENHKLRMPKGYTKERKIKEPQYVIDRYLAGESSRSIALDFGVEQESVRRVLIENDVPRTNNRSYLEDKLIQLFDKHDVKYIKGSRKSIAPFEIDFLVGNVGFELHGLQTHSRHHPLYGKPRLYHHNKYSMSMAAGIRLFQFWEDDLNNRFEVISSMILNSIGLTKTRLHARKCVISSVGANDATTFYEANHIQGAPGNNTRTLGLYYEGILVSCLGYVEQRSKTVIVRFCSLLNTNVMGAFSRLLKRVPGKMIITHSHNDISVGGVYSSNGFTLSRENVADMWYTDYKRIYNRQGFMKSKLASKLDNFDPEKTEVENMLINGYDQIFKSGTKTWQLIRQ